MDAIYLLVATIFLKNAHEGINPMSDDSIRNYSVINISLMVAMNITYILTQFLNPGIRNLTNIQAEEYTKYGKVLCDHCNAYRTENMEHCDDCKVCIEGLDHHCGFFSKCIGGFQKYFFYAFLCISFLGFFGLIITMTANIGL
jgi:palmitoyltransferase ZDHHC9/14/18/palmitoyltransferase